MSDRFRWLLAAALACSIAACSSQPPTGTVEGEVTLDGQALADGSLQFVPVDGQAQTGGATIKDGKFTAELPLAKMKVEIHANKVIGKKKMYDTPDSPTYDDIVELIPPRYNANSDLTLDVKPGAQAVKYELKSK